MSEFDLKSGNDKTVKLLESASELLNITHKLQLVCEYPNLGAGVWVGAQVDPMVGFVSVVGELGWG